MDEGFSREEDWRIRGFAVFDDLGAFEVLVDLVVSRPWVLFLLALSGCLARGFVGVGASGTEGGASFFTGEPLLLLEPESLAPALVLPKSEDCDERLTATLERERD